MPPLNTTLIRGCSELQGPATQECLWHGSDFVAPSLCSLLGPILHLIFHPFYFFFELFWWKRWMKVWRLRHEEAMGTLSVVVWLTLDPGHLAPDRPGRHTELSPHQWSQSFRVLARHLFSWRLLGLFFYLFYVLPVSPRCELWDPGSASELCCWFSVHFFFFFFFSSLHIVCFGMLSPHINKRIP